MQIRKAVLFMFMVLLRLPIVAQMSTGSYQAFKVEKGKTPETISINIIPLGNGVLQFNEGDPRKPLIGTYHIIVNRSSYNIGNFKKGIVCDGWEKYSYDVLIEKSSYKNGRLDGKSVQYYSNSTGHKVYTYKNGIAQHAISYHPGGKVAEERFYDENGRYHGEMISYDKDGEVKAEQRYQNGQRHGQQMETDRNGYRILEEYKQGKKTGEYCRRYPNGNIYEKGTYDENGKKCGKWITGEENGDLKTEGHYLNDKLHGEKRAYYSGNRLKSIEEYTEGKLNGRKVEYSDAPNVVTREVRYANERLHGEFKVYHDGILWREGTYKDGNMVHEKEYTEGKLQIVKLLDENGALVNVEKYDRTGKRTYKNNSFKKHPSIKLKENTSGVTDVEIE